MSKLIRILIVGGGLFCLLQLLFDWTAVRENLKDGQFVIRVFNLGSKTNTVAVTSEEKNLSISAPAHLRSPSWLKKGTGQGIQIGGSADRIARNHALELQAIGSGELEIYLSAPWVPDNRKKPRKIVISYPKYSLADGQAYPHTGAIWCNNALRLHRPVKDGERIQFVFSVEKGWSAALSSGMRRPDFMLAFLLVFVFGWLFNLTFQTKNTVSDTAQSASVGRLDILDIGKGLACMGVVFMHYKFAGGVGIYVSAASRFAIPFFFAVSGFFLCSGSFPDPGKVVRKAQHAFKLLLVGMLVGLVYRISYDWLVYHSFDRLLQDAFSVRSFVGTLLMCGTSYYSVMWFVSALLTCYLFVLLVCTNERRYRQWVAMTPLFVFAALFVHECFRLCPDLLRIGFTLMDSKICFLWRNTFVFRGLCWFLLGCFLRLHVDKLRKIKVHVAWLIVATVFGIFLNVLEYRLTGLPYVAQAFFGSYVTTIALFVLALRTSDRSFPKLAWLGKNLSMYVYVLHIAVGNYLGLMARQLSWHWWESVRAPVVLTVTILVSYCVYKTIGSMKGRIHV